MYVFFYFERRRSKFSLYEMIFFRIGTKYRVPVMNNNKSAHLAGGFNAGSTSQLEGPYEAIRGQDHILKLRRNFPPFCVAAHFT